MHHQVAKIKGLENISLMRKLNSLIIFENVQIKKKNIRNIRFTLTCFEFTRL